jgi:hypothetical protein
LALRYPARERSISILLSGRTGLSSDLWNENISNAVSTESGVTILIAVLEDEFAASIRLAFSLGIHQDQIATHKKQATPDIDGISLLIEVRVLSVSKNVASQR